MQANRCFQFKQNKNQSVKMKDEEKKINKQRTGTATTNK